MSLKKCFCAIIIFALFLSLCSCKNRKIQNDEVSVFNNDDFPSFVVESISVSAGEKDAVVFVELKDNPGFLTMAMNIEYDSNAMILQDVKCGSDYTEYNFIGPKNKQSGCSASLFITDVPEKIVDGKLLELHFSMVGSLKSGKYPIKISRPDNGGIVDRYKETLVINNAVGYITIN